MTYQWVSHTFTISDHNPALLLTTYSIPPGSPELIGRSTGQYDSGPYILGSSSSSLSVFTLECRLKGSVRLEGQLLASMSARPNEFVGITMRQLPTAGNLLLFKPIHHQPDDSYDLAGLYFFHRLLELSVVLTVRELAVYFNPSSS